jgi:signal peptidase I
MMRHKKSFGGELLGWGKTLVFAFAAALAINNLLIVNARIPSGSMESTIMTGDRVIANRLAYLNGPPGRLQVVVFRVPDDEGRLFVKRIIGLPGETVEIKAGQVYIDGSPLAEGSYLRERPVGEYGPFTVPAYHYFMLGDNRNASHDSKDWRKPYVAENKILGEVMFGYYPRLKALK